MSTPKPTPQSIPQKPLKPRLRGTGTVRYRGTTYEARWRDNGGKEFGRRFPTERAASEFLDRQLVAKATASNNGTRYRSPNFVGPTFAVEAEGWFADRAQRLTPKTITTYRSILDLHLMPVFGTLPVRRITLASVERFETTLIQKGLSRGSRKNIMRVLGPILARSKRHGHTDANVMLDLERQPSSPNVRNPTAIGSAQVESLASCVAPHYRAMVIFAAYTGMRAGEVAGVTWGDLEREGWVHVQRSVSEISMGEAKRVNVKSVKPGFHVGPPKNKYDRRTILLPSVLALLGSPGADNQRLFSTESGAPIRWDNFRKRIWAPAVAKAVDKARTESGPPFPPGLRFHDLRHAFVSIAYNELGLNFRQIAEMSGHRDIATMLNVYTHVLAGWDEALPARFDEVRTRARLRLLSPDERGAA